MFRRVQALVLSPTRELATQTEQNIRAIGDHMSVQVGHSIGYSRVESVGLVGELRWQQLQWNSWGAGMRNQQAALRQCCARLGRRVC